MTCRKKKKQRKEAMLSVQEGGDFHVEGVIVDSSEVLSATQADDTPSSGDSDGTTSLDDADRHGSISPLEERQAERAVRPSPNSSRWRRLEEDEGQEVHSPSGYPENSVSPNPTIIKGRRGTRVSQRVAVTGQTTEKRSGQMADSATRTHSNLPLALGNNCSVSAQCSNMATCLDGRCDCPQCYQPSDERHCHAIRQSALSVTSWMAIMIMTSGFLFILLLIVYVYVLGQRRPPHTSTMMYGQVASEPTPNIFLVPVTAMRPGGETPDSVRISTKLGAGSSSSRSSPCPGAVERWQARIARAASEMPNVSERSRQLRSWSDSFIRNSRSAKYPLLQNISTPSRHVNVKKGRRKTGTASQKVQVRRKKGRDLSSLPDNKGQRRHEGHYSCVNQHVVTPTENEHRHGSIAAAAKDSVGVAPESSSSCKDQLDLSTVTWGSIGKSLDSLLSIPVVARVHTCSSRIQTTLESERDLVLTPHKL